MNNLDTLLGWSEPISWGQNRPPHAIPDGLRPDMLVRSDLIVRSNQIDVAQRAEYPMYYPDMIWLVIDGESFLLECKQPLVTHTVASHYRIWAGELPDEAEEMTIEELLRELGIPEEELV